VGITKQVCRGQFTALYKTKNNGAKGLFQFSEIKITYLKIEQIVKLSVFDLEENKTGDYLFVKKIRPKSIWNLFYHQTDIFILLDERKVYPGPIYQVLIKNIRRNYKSISDFLPQHEFEISGDIYFQIDIKEPSKIVTTSTVNHVNGVNIETNLLDDGKIVVENINKVEENSTVINNDKTLVVKRNNSKGTKLFWNIIGLLLLISFMAFCWSTFSALFYLILFLSIGYLISRFKLSKFFSIASFLLISILGGALIYYFYKPQGQIVPRETKSDNIKIEPPRKSDEDNGNNIDYLFNKEIKWRDFIPNSYMARYTTSSLAFFDSQGKHKKYVADIVSNDPVQYFFTLYNNLEQIDNAKIDAVTKTLSAQASSKNLNMLQTAEMVVTFIQEIPYYLIHDLSCEEIVKNGNSDFVSSYHKDRKPCLANIPGGVQSPYEFLHTLKGDCDTRSLLGYAILKKLNIPASVWVSSTYGHSILGVGLPVGGGSYKNIQGVNHYAVELTSKGFRIGMIPAEIQNMNNWDITLFNNL
jgi:hypothetical protein